MNSERTVENLRGWLRHEISKSSVLPWDGIDFSMTLAELGLSSIHTVRLTGELERLLDVELEPTLLGTFGSVEEMCTALTRMRDGRRARAEVRSVRPVRIAATFTAEPIQPALHHVLTLLGQDVEIAFAGYNQVFQELLNPNATLVAGENGVNIVLIRVEDWFRFEDGAPEVARVERAVDDFLAAVQGREHLVVALAPHSPPAVRRLGLTDIVDALDARILAGLSATPAVAALDLRRVVDDYPVPRIWDERRDALGHIPYTQGCFAALATALGRHIHSRWFGPAKVIVLDCDNTIWGGVTGEEGPHGVDVSGPYHALQAFMVEQMQAGKLLCLASKNNEADVWATFDAHPEMPLKREHITAHRIDWSPKSANIASMAEDLGLGLDAFVFLDDSPMEVAEVSESLPAVLTLQLPSPVRIPEFLAHQWAFDGGATTDEDRRRTELYRSNEARSEVRREAVSFEGFLERLELEVTLAPLAEADLERAAQLTSRTNQFNANKVVRTRDGMAERMADPALDVQTVRVRDRFGDYGLVGLVDARTDGTALVCETFLMSCRVLGRRVEHAMVGWLHGLAYDRELETVQVRLTSSARNVPVRSFLESLGGEVLQTGSLPDALATAVVEHTLPPALAQERSATGLTELADIGGSMDRLLAEVSRTSRLHRPDLATAYVTPRSSWEKKIASIWRDVLGMDRIGVYDSFYELGGDSLLAAEAFARMWDLGVPESISLQTIAEPTVAVLARAIEDVKAGRTPDLLADTFSLADEGQLAEDIRHEGYDVASYTTIPEVVLITGSTGYLGAFLLYEFLQHAGVQAVCMVRASSPLEGRARILANLHRYGLTIDASRLDVVVGDLTEPRLGLTEPAFRALAERIDTIVHSAAWVNFVYPYDHLRATNVDSTEEVLRLAIAATPKAIAVHFVSTLGVIMSTGYGRDREVKETDPLLFADDLLNGYEQTKYASDKMVWTAFKERGIPGNVYRPGMVSGLSDGTYHKLDEFLPQFLKGCLQLGSWPLLDTSFEIAPIDFVSKAIVHIAMKGTHLNQAFFTLHPKPRKVSEYIQFHKDFGYEVRGLPWDTWKHELLGLGAERLRKNGLFPFVDFIRALAEEQVYFPPTERTRFEEAIADLDVVVPDQLELLERYTRYFVDCGYYENLPSGPRSLKPSERAEPSRPEEPLDERLRFDPDRVDFSESYYVLWTDPDRDLSMIIRYVLHNGILEEFKMAEVWCGFWDRRDPDAQIALRQRFPIGRAVIENTAERRLSIGPCGYGDERAWGEVFDEGVHVTWDLELDKAGGLVVDRVPHEHPLFPHFQSNGVRHWITGTVTVNGKAYPLQRQLGSDGHYWNTKHLRGWAWAHCADFDGEGEFVVEAIGARFGDHSPTSTWITIRDGDTTIQSDIVDAYQFNREVDPQLTSWGFEVTRGDVRYLGRVEVSPEDMCLLIHALPDDKYLYTHVTYQGNMTVDIQRKQGGKWWTVSRRTARRTASFEVTRPERNPDVTREFRIVRVR